MTQSAYYQTLDYLFSQLPMYQRIGPAAYKANLDNTIELCRYLGNPEKKIKCIHVAGTNGKGSVAHMLASVFQEAGYKTGLATSPHLKDFRERIRVNGQMIPENEVVGFVNDHKTFFEKLSPSFFEMAMALTFDYFARQKLDIAIIETGLGGRLDSSNVIEPELSVITNIGLDHTNLLGNSLEEIAKEKAGIIKKNTPVVIGRTQKEVQPVFENAANKLAAPLFYADKIFELSGAHHVNENDSVFLHITLKHEQQIMNIRLGLTGMYQVENALSVVAALDVLKKHKGIVLPDSALTRGLHRVVENTGMQGRWQLIGREPAIISDVAHNHDGIKQVVGQIRSTPHNDLHVVFGMVDDKERHLVLKALPVNAKYYFCRPSVPRGLDAVVLLRDAAGYGLTGNAYDSVSKALSAAKQNAAKDDLIFVGGSTFVVAEAI